MPDTGLLFMSVLSLVVGTSVILFPQGILKLSAWLNRTVQMVDEPLMRYRYLVALAAFAASYAFFRIALLLPDLRG